MWWYISSIIICYCIFKASIKLCRCLLEKNGRSEKLEQLYEKEKGKTNISLLVICFIPVIRLLFLIIMYWLVFCNDEYFNKIINDKFNQD